MGKKIILTEEQLADAMLLRLVNCNKLKGTMLKYMRLSYVLEMLERKEMVFVTPELWNDPYETRFLKTDYSQIGYNRPEQIYCLCARADNENEEASWKIYSGPQDDPLVKITVNALLLFNKYIRDFVEKNGCRAYFSKVEYMSASNILNLHKTEHPLHGKYFGHLDEEGYVRLMSLKRMAFKYEKENRLFIIPGDKVLNADKGLLRVPIDYDIFPRFTFHPMERIVRDDMASRLKEKIYKAELDTAKAEITRYCKGVKVYKSVLYSNVKPLETILE